MRPETIGSAMWDLYLKDQIVQHFKKTGTELNLKYIDPSYTIRSMPASPYDSAFCLMLGHNAVHAAMAGRTNMVVGAWQRQFTHVPIAMAVAARRKIEPGGKALEQCALLHRPAASDGIGRGSKPDTLCLNTGGSHENTSRHQNGTLHWVLFLLPRMRKTVTPEPVLASQRDSNPLCRRFEHRIRGTGLSRLRPCSLRGSLSH